MAVNFKTLDDRLKLSPLSNDELAAIEWVEQHIDKELTERYKGNEVRFDMGIIHFTRTTSGGSTAWPDVRKKLMKEELEKRFNKAGWTFTDEYADVHDRYSQDYVIVKGKE